MHLLAKEPIAILIFGFTCLLISGRRQKILPLDHPIAELQAVAQCLLSGRGRAIMDKTFNSMP